MSKNFKIEQLDQKRFIKVNDLNKEEFIQLLDESGLDYDNLVTKYVNLSKGD